MRRSFFIDIEPQVPVFELLSWDLPGHSKSTKRAFFHEATTSLRLQN